MSDHLIQPVKWTMHKPGESPVFTTWAIHVEIEDEAAGPYLKITQNREFKGDDAISLDPDDVEVFFDLIRTAREQCRKLQAQEDA